MNNYRCNEVNVKFSIPGRIRLKVTLLYKNKFFAQKLSETIKSISNIVSVHTNTFNSNLLIIYNNKELSESELKPCIEYHITKLIHTQENQNNCINTSIYEGEKVIAKRVTLISLVLTGIISIGSINVATIISIMILSSPFILFYIRNKGYIITSHFLLEREINLPNNSLVKFFSEVDEIFIQDNLIIDKKIVKKYFDFLEQGSIPVRRLIVNGELKEPIFGNSRILINNLRNIGVNTIFILSKEKNRFIDYAKDTLDINSLTLEEACMTKYINNFSEDELIIILGKSNEENVTNQSLVINLYMEINDVKCKYQQSHILCKKDILEIPYSILFCKYVENTINTTQNISIAINMIGVMFALGKYIFIRGSIIVYLFNFIVSTVLLKTKIKGNNTTVLKSLK